LSKRDDRDILYVSTEPPEDRFAKGCAIGLPLTIIVWLLIIMGVLTLAEQLR